MSNYPTSKIKKCFSIYELVFLLVLLLTIRYVLLVTLGVNPIASVLFAASCAVAFGIGVICFLFDPQDMVSLIGLLTIILIYYMLWANGKLDGIQSTLSIVIAVLFLLAFKTEHNFYKAEKAYKVLVTATAFILCLLMFFGKSFVQGHLLYYMLNGNQSALFLLCFFLNIYLFKYNCSKKELNLLYNVLLILLGYGCFRTGCRSVLLIIAVLFIIQFINRISIRLLKIITFFTLAFSVLLPFCTASVISILGEDFTLFGETIYTGREILWGNIVSKILNTPFQTRLGENVPVVGMAYYGAGLNSHNAFLEIAWRYSLPAAVLFIIVLWCQVRHLLKTVSPSLLKRILPVMCAIFIHMSVESTFFVGAIDFSLLVLLPIVIAVNKERRTEK